jgi:hypothetical protein
MTSSHTTLIGLPITLSFALLCFHCLTFASLSQLLTPYVGLILSLVNIIVAQYVRSPWRKVPPGPKGLPILGNALQLKDKQWMFEKECKQKFGTSANSFALHIHQRDFRKCHVLECFWPACYHF